MARLQAVDEEFLYQTSIPVGALKIDPLKGMRICGQTFCSDEMLGLDENGKAIVARRDCSHPSLVRVQLERGNVTAWSKLIATMAKANADDREFHSLYSAVNETRESHHIPFASMVSAIGRRFKLAKPDILLQHLDLALLNSAGIFGEADQWLRRSDQTRCRDSKSSISLTHLRRGSYTQRQQIGMWNQARAFDALASEPPGLDLSIVANTKWGKLV